VYGDPLTVDGKTVVPVARVAYGFGTGTDDEAPDGQSGRVPGRRESAPSVISVCRLRTK